MCIWGKRILIHYCLLKTAAFIDFSFKIPGQSGLKWPSQVVTGTASVLRFTYVTSTKCWPPCCCCLKIKGMTVQQLRQLFIIIIISNVCVWVFKVSYPLSDTHKMSASGPILMSLTAITSILSVFSMTQ